jgi:hypothetical protein
MHGLAWGVWAGQHALLACFEFESCDWTTSPIRFDICCQMFSGPGNGLQQGHCIPYVVGAVECIAGVTYHVNLGKESFYDGALAGSDPCNCKENAPQQKHVVGALVTAYMPSSSVCLCPRNHAILSQDMPSTVLCNCGRIRTYTAMIGHHIWTAQPPHHTTPWSWLWDPNKASHTSSSANHCNQLQVT